METPRSRDRLIPVLGESGNALSAFFLLILGSIVIVAGLTPAWVMRGHVEILIEFAWLKLRGGYSLEERLEQFGKAASGRLAVHFQTAGVVFPPKQVAIVVLKHERVLEVYARDYMTSWRFIRSYPVLAASGKLGPKVREGDRQVPEGLYRVTFLNPNSLFHVSLRLDYPNGFDEEMAELEHRTQLGTDIMIHGKRTSAGCLAMGDEAIEEPFVPAALTRPEIVNVFISPYDFWRPPAVALPVDLPSWTASLYAQISTELAKMPR